MHGITNLKIIAGLAVLLMMSIPADSFSRVNSLIGGLSTGYDYSSDGDDGNDDDRYESVFLSPMLLFTSRSEVDSFTLEASPRINYSLEDYNWDWNSNARVAADRFITKDWQMGISNHYLVSDYYYTRTVTSVDAVEDPLQEETPTDPELSSDRQRQRFWRNTLRLFSNNFYQEDSSIRLDLGYIALRNEDDTFGGNEEYDRYSAGLRNRHRYNPIWASIADFEYVIGDFKQNPNTDALSNDLKEYRLLLGLDNESIVHNPISLSFNYTGARYDESEQDDNDIYQMRLTWRRDYSPRMYTRLGAGPSYAKTEGQNGEWGGNGIAELNYDVVEHGSINFQVEKIYDVENFSGYDQSGLVDIWATRLTGSYRLQEDLTIEGRLVYRYEDREQPAPTPGNPDKLDKYHDDVYNVGTSLSYAFWQFYTASVDYDWTKRDSDQPGDDYDDHRVMLTLSWQKELFHW